MQDLAPIVSKAETKAKMPLRTLRLQLVWLIPLIFYLLQIFLIKNERWGDFYARHVFPLLSAPLRVVISWIPISFLFLTAVFVLPSCVIFLFYKLWKILRNKTGRAIMLKRLAYRVLTVLAILYVVYMLMHGFNFARRPIADILALETKPRTVEELYDVTLKLAELANFEKSNLPHDDERKLLLTDSRNAYLSKAAIALPGIYPSTFVRPKAVPLSEYWSYTNITGMYFPFFIEANVNADTTSDEFLFSALHEIAHVQGFAKEDEANFMGFYSGSRHPLAEYRYAAYLNAFIHCYNRLADTSPEFASVAWQKLSPHTQADIRARNLYWDKFKGPIEELSTNINDSFLKANFQEAGVESYGMVVDLLLAYYDKELTID